MSKTLFSRIIDGEIPSYTIYENPYVYAFLDIRPVQKGHILVVPRTPVAYFSDLEDPFYTEVFQATKLISKALQRATQCERVGVLIAGFDVPHTHVHLIPLECADDLDLKKATPASSEDLAQMQQRIISFLI